MHLVVPPGGNSSETRRIELGPTALTIGRGESCAIRIDVPGVDDEHAKISEVALIALGPDCAIGDVPLEQGSRRLLMPGDEIQIGSIVVILEGDDPSHEGESRLDLPRIRVVEGSNFGDELLMKEENRPYVIGRGAKCDLVIDDREVSREHVKLVRRGFNVYVQDQSSTRGSWLGRSAVYQGATVEWTRPRMMRVGATVLSLELPEAVRRAAVPLAAPSNPLMTPPPRTSGPSLLQRGGSDPGLNGPDSSPMPASVRPLVHTAPMPMVGPNPDAPTQKLGAFAYDPMASPGPMAAPAPLPAPVVYTPKPQPLPPAPAIHDGSTYGAQFGGAAANVNVQSQPLGLSPPPMMMGAATPAQRKAWKKSGPVIGRFSGLLLLAIAGLAIAGALFVVFSLLE